MLRASVAIFFVLSVITQASETPKGKLHDFVEKYQVAGFTQDSETYTGYIQVRQGGSKLFYMLHSKANGRVSDPAPLIIWLQGGAGCSSVAGDISELGPMQIVTFDPATGNTAYQKRQVTWADTNHILFIDSPIGTGYSVAMPGETVTTADSAAVDLSAFLARFVQIYPGIQANGVYLFGEGYGAKFVIALARNITNMAKPPLQIAGIGLANGWVDPVNQLNFYDAFLYSAGVISTRDRFRFTEIQNRAVMAAMGSDFTGMNKALDDLTTYFNLIGVSLDPYNFRVRGEEQKFGNEPWAQHQKTKDLFGIPATVQYQQCSPTIKQQFARDNLRSYAASLNQLVTQFRLKTVIYNGQNDMICNIAGTHTYLSRILFNPQDDVTQAPKQPFLVGGTVAGTRRRQGVVSQYVLYNAGHYPALSQPSYARGLLSDFMDYQPTQANLTKKVDL